MNKNKKLFSFVNTACGCQVWCYGLGMIGFLINSKDLDNKFNRGSNILCIAKYSCEDPDLKLITLGDYVDLNTLFEYVKRFNLSCPVDISFYGAKRGKKKRPYLMGAYIC